jgi:hypothetical protein
MIEYHVMGKIIEEKCFIKIDSTDNWFYGWLDEKVILPSTVEQCSVYMLPEKTFDFKKETVLKEYKECFTIRSEREFKTKDIIHFKDKDFEVKYKYNKELEQHQLYIDYVIDTIKLPENLIIECRNNFNDICKYKREQEESNKLNNRLKKIFKRK